ncbi:MAG: HAMP domain-containing histidine kinase [Myxococcales bacterium]|nr:HAMP domain-containing histidine kinase [Myxococcales bacterium]
MQRSLVPALVLGALVAALLATVAQGSLRLRERPFPGFLVWDNGALVAFHDESFTGALAGLPLGSGRIVEVDGAPFEGGRALLEAARARRAGTVVRYRVATEEGERDYAVPTMRLSFQSFVATFGNYLFNAFCFAGIGVVALALRPDSAQARALAGATVAMGLLFALAIDYFTAYRFTRLCQLVEAASPLPVAALALHFPAVRGTRALRRGVLAVLGAGGAADFGGRVAWLYDASARARIATLVAHVELAAITVGMLVGLAHAALRGATTDDRVRAAIVLAAAVSGLLVPALAILAFFGLGAGFSFTWVTFLLPVFPAAVLFATVRHDLLRAERFARLAVGYGVTTAGLAVGYSSLLLVLDRWLIRSGARGTPVEFALLVGVAASFNPLYRRVQSAIDRVFYRSDLDAARRLERLSVLLAARPSEAEAVEIVAREVGLALQVDAVEIALGPEVAGGGFALVEPIVHGDDRLGALRCGAKSSGAPFSAAERDFAVGAASQAATAIRSARSLEDLRAAQDALVRAERLAAIGEVAGAVAHGVRNPLAGIRAAAQMAQEIDDPAERAETLGDLIAGADRLDERVRRLLDFARMLAPEIERVDVRTVVENVRSVLASRAASQGVALEVVARAEGPIYAHADPRQLEEALLELVGNALHATGEGGRVAVGIEADAARVRVVVRDTGRGIPAAVQARVFDLFFTTREEGTGMGLATVRKMLERQDGSVELVESGAGGTAFALEVPAAAPAAA